MTSREIVLGTDAGTFWTGKTQQPWSADPLTAKTFASPRDAWQAATQIQEAQSEYLEGTHVELHTRDPDELRLPQRVTSLAQANNRPALRAHWLQGFGEALPPDLPAALPEQDGISRLEDYLRDVPWDDIRSRHGGVPDRAEDLGLAPSFRESMTRLSERDPEAVSALCRTHVPADFSEELLTDFLHPDSAPERQASPEVGQSRGGQPVSAAAPDANEITRDRDREADRFDPAYSIPTSERSAPITAGSQQPPPLPPFVRRHFVRAGDQFYYRQSPDRLAFTVRGETFRAEDASVSVATALVDLAESRGWSALRVKGSKEFRRLVWATAAKRGLSVDGYSPSAGERALLDQELDSLDGSRGAERAESRAGGRERDRPEELMAGVLLDHGAAPYQHQQGNSPSYFVSLRGPSGEAATHWGQDLERALSESGAVVGDQVDVARLGRQRVQVREAIRDDAGVVIDHATREVTRNAWSVTVREKGSVTRNTDDPKGRGGIDATDPIASKVVELFTSERLARLPPDDRQRFQDLYDQAKARLEARDRPQETSTSSRNDHQERGRTAQGR